MRTLVEETLHRHPQCYIYICSILPVNCPGVSRDMITRLNTGIESLQRAFERVFYVNTMAAFSNYESPWLLFDRDHVHPSKHGVTVMMNTISKKVISHHKSFHQFTSKKVTPTLSFASSVSGDSSAQKAPEKSPFLERNQPNYQRDSHTSLGRHVQYDSRGCHTPPRPSRYTMTSQPHPADVHKNFHRDNMTVGSFPMHMYRNPPVSTFDHSHPWFNYPQARPEMFAPWPGYYDSSQRLMYPAHVPHPRDTGPYETNDSF